jgi:hypothetical protein
MQRAWLTLVLQLRTRVWLLRLLLRAELELLTALLICCLNPSGLAPVLLAGQVW